MISFQCHLSTNKVRGTIGVHYRILKPIVELANRRPSIENRCKLMSSYRRNVLVGITVIGAMIVLAWMILRFGGKSASLFAPEQVAVRLVTDRADGISDG